MDWVYERWKAPRWAQNDYELYWHKLPPATFWIASPLPWQEPCTALIKEGPKALVRFQKEEA